MKIEHLALGAAALGAAYLLLSKSSDYQTASLAGGDSIPNKPDGGNFIARIIQQYVPGSTIGADGYDTKVPSTVITGGQTVTSSNVTPSNVISQAAGAVAGTIETTISSARLGSTGIIASGDNNFKVQLTSLGSIKETFSSGGFDAFGSRLPEGTLSKAAAVFGSTTPTVKTASGTTTQLIPVTSGGQTVWYSPSTYAMTFKK